MQSMAGGFGQNITAIEDFQLIIGCTVSEKRFDVHRDIGEKQLLILPLAVSRNLLNSAPQLLY